MVDMEKLSGKYTWRVLREIASGTSGFKGLLDSLPKTKTRVSTKTLSDRLKELEDEGLIKRELLPTRPPRSVYTITEKGRKVLELIDKLEEL
jgi:DNA-binding HxlR family transcriptional regulator